jgi:colicin immunity protein/pyocin immunity protein
MQPNLTKEELIELVRKVITCEGTEEENDEWLEIFLNSVPHPEASNLIYYSKEDLTPEEIVERALAYKPILLPSGDTTE